MMKRRQRFVPADSVRGRVYIYRVLLMKSTGPRARPPLATIRSLKSRAERR